MIADGTPIFGLTGWAGTFAALDAAAIGCIVLMAMVAVLEERKIRRENRAQKLKQPECAGNFFARCVMPGFLY